MMIENGEERKVIERLIECREAYGKIGKINTQQEIENLLENTMVEVQSLLSFIKFID